MSFLLNLKKGISKSSRYISNNLQKIKSNSHINEKILEELEEILIGADLGINVTSKLIDELKSKKINKEINLGEIQLIFAQEIEKILFNHEADFEVDTMSKPNVYLFVGVNGSGKTTTIGKLASNLKENYKVLIAACDTFRAAATNQIIKLAEKSKIKCYEGKKNQDPASVAFEACEIAKKNNYDVLLIDTAGRFSNNTDLMNQLLKIKKVINNSLNIEKINTFLVLDGSTGNNMLNQFEVYNKIVGIHGLIITKLDGTAKGGALVSVADKYKVPIYYIGIGEKIDDLYSFKAREFSLSLFDLEKLN